MSYHITDYCCVSALRAEDKLQAGHKKEKPE
jgi:hypothetical protein